MPRTEILWRKETAHCRAYIIKDNSPLFHRIVEHLDSGELGVDCYGYCSSPAHEAPPHEIILLRRGRTKIKDLHNHMLAAIALAADSEVSLRQIVVRDHDTWQ